MSGLYALQNVISLPLHDADEETDWVSNLQTPKFDQRPPLRTCDAKSARAALSIE